jgi:hypothetical protein
MPQCSQCNRPAMYMVGEHPLCLQCNALHQNILDRQLAALERQQQQALDDMEMATGVRLPGRRRPQSQPQPIIVAGSTFHSINIRDSNVGVANTGQLHQVDTAVSVIGRQGEPQLAGALKALTEAVVASTTMSAGTKQETVEILSTLASEATAPAAQRRGGVARTLLTRLRELLSVAADVAQVSQVAVPLIAAAFGGG